MYLCVTTHSTKITHTMLSEIFHPLVYTKIPIYLYTIKCNIITVGR